MKYKKSKKLTEQVEDRYIIMASDPAAVFGKRRAHLHFRRVILLAACLSLVLVTVLVALPALIDGSQLPGTDTPGTEEVPVVSQLLADHAYVQVHRVVPTEATPMGQTKSYTVNSEDVLVESQKSFVGTRLILLHVYCAEDETVILTPSERGRLIEVEYRTNRYGEDYWMEWNEEEESYYYPDEYYRAGEGRESEVHAKAGTSLLWQYEYSRRYESREDTSYPCIRDNFVDFLVLGADGEIKGGGSVYIGGLDLVPLTENPKYYGQFLGELNASYRPCVLGSYSYLTSDGSPVPEDFHTQTISDLHAGADEAHERLFANLSEDSYRITMRNLMYEYASVFVSGYGVCIWPKSPGYDHYAIVHDGDYARAFLIYGFSYGEIVAQEIYTADQYGYMVTGVYTLADGTLAYFDENSYEVFTIVPPEQS